MSRCVARAPSACADLLLLYLPIRAIHYHPGAIMLASFRPAVLSAYWMSPGEATRVPRAARPLAADAVERCPTPTVISPWAEAQRFHLIKGRWFKSASATIDDEALADAEA